MNRTQCHHPQTLNYRCNGSGTCARCECMKEGRECRNCLPLKKNRCLNSSPTSQPSSQPTTTGTVPVPLAVSEPTDISAVGEASPRCQLQQPQPSTPLSYSTVVKTPSSSTQPADQARSATAVGIGGSATAVHTTVELEQHSTPDGAPDSQAPATTSTPTHSHGNTNHNHLHESANEDSQADSIPERPPPTPQSAEIQSCNTQHTQCSPAAAQPTCLLINAARAHRILTEVTEAAHSTQAAHPTVMSSQTLDVELLVTLDESDVGHSNNASGATPDINTRAHELP